MTRLLRTLVILHVAACTVTVKAQGPDLIGYWHNWNDASAPYIPPDQIDPRYSVIELAFAEPLPGTTSAMEFVPSLEIPGDFLAQVAALRAAGKKVLISIGGANATVQLNSDAERDQFVASMMGILTSYGFDGIDLDLEGSSVSISGGTIATPVDAGILRLINAVGTIADQFETTNGHPMMLTMAPETAFVQGGMSAFGGIWGAYLPIIDALRDRLDILQVQLYNSGSMFGIDGGTYAQGTADFIVSQTEAVIQGFNTGGGFFEGLPPEKVAVALPACTNAAGGGYTDTATVRAAMEYLLGEGPQPGAYALVQPGGYPNLRGMMTWSVNWDAVSACNGAYSYAENYERIFGDVSTSVSNINRSTVLVSPNPVSEEIHINTSFNGVLAIRDLSGRAVRWINDGTIGANNSTRINVRDLPAGTYLLECDADGGHIRTRFVKQ